MQKWFFISVLFFTALGFAQNDSLLVKETFNTYKAQILNQNGAEAFKVVSESTKKYYQDIFQNAIQADSSTVQSLSLFKRMMVLSVRHRIDKETMLTMKKDDLFKYVVDKGWIGKQSVQNTMIGSIQEDGTNAMVQLVKDNEELPYYFQFVYENDAWKFDLKSITETTELALVAYLKEEKIPENTYILKSLERISGKKPEASIWLPLNAN